MMRLPALGLLLAALMIACGADAKPTIAQLLDRTPTLSVLKAAVGAAGLRGVLDDPTAKLTVFAPVDSAIVARIANISCASNDWITVNRCSNASELLGSYSLPYLLLNHVAAGKVGPLRLNKIAQLQTLGGASYAISTDGGLKIGGAEVVTASIKASNGLVHLISDVLLSDTMLNETTVRTYLTYFADLGADKVSPLTFTPTTIATMLVGHKTQNIPYYQAYRQEVANTDGGYTYPMPLKMDVTNGETQPCIIAEPPRWEVPLPVTARPASDEDIAYLSVLELAYLIKNKLLTSTELTNIYLARMKKYDPLLQVVVTTTEAMAREQAAAADAATAAGIWLGPLHGIPYGLKDLISAPPYRTTWGSGAFVDQVIPQKSGIVKKLDSAGAVLVAKVSTGEMATGDNWWGGSSRCPWNIALGAGGSSAGPGAASAAALMGFTIGTETGGSILGPATRNGVSGFRPTIGLVSRSWTMALAQTFDKPGPMARSAADCAAIFDLIRGRDKDDPNTCNVALPDPFKMNIAQMKIGYSKETPPTVVDYYSSLGATMVPLDMQPAFSLNPDIPAMYRTLAYTEAAAYFDKWLRSGLLTNNTVQEGGASWPHRLRQARLVPAVEYVQAMRRRGIMVSMYNKAIEGLDAWIGGTGYNTAGNLANFPGIIVTYGFTGATTPAGFDAAATPRKTPLTFGVYGAGFKDAEVLATAMAFQKATTFHKQRPPIDLIEPAILNNCTLRESPFGRCSLSAAVLAKLSETGIGNKPVDTIMTY